ncbi:MAG: Nif3-like dinuclear metal center hexameric protein [Gemmatimonadaceae bacterium]|jgi:dinuclear metal center YbgI/SA1388 family protein|nr:Nif3-like dinuclear metal center hexameric protein [Gemmatimonadaceae bacterium]
MLLVHTARDIADRLDAELATATTPDYPPALNGLQVDNRRGVTRVAAAVDCSARTIAGARAAGADLLLVHHGLFWGGLQRLTGAYGERVRAVLDADLALYAAHLPLDCHPRHGNSVLLAHELGLVPTAGFARYQHIECGVRGESEVATQALLERVASFCAPWGHTLRHTPAASGRITRRWAICSGAGASAESVRECVALGIDTLIVGEGPHWSAVDAEEHGLVIAYAGHYATETLGVRAVAQWLEQTLGLPWTFIHVPTGH